MFIGIEVPKSKKPILNKRKKKIQDAFIDKLNLYVDFPLPGTGTSTDGNTARKLFANAEVRYQSSSFSIL